MLDIKEVKYEYIDSPSEEALREYERWKTLRKVNSFALFPPDVKEKLLPVINELLSLGIQSADLVGSFSRGDYCMNDQDIVIKSTVRFAKLSDVDIVIHDRFFEMPTSCDVLNNDCFYATAIPVIRDGKFI